MLSGFFSGLSSKHSSPSKTISSTPPSTGDSLVHSKPHDSDIVDLSDSLASFPAFIPTVGVDKRRDGSPVCLMCHVSSSRSIFSPCEHPFCRGCVQDLMAVSVDTSLSQSSIQCPVCYVITTGIKNIKEVDPSVISCPGNEYDDMSDDTDVETIPDSCKTDLNNSARFEVKRFVQEDTSVLSSSMRRGIGHRRHISISHTISVTQAEQVITTAPIEITLIDDQQRRHSFMA